MWARVILAVLLLPTGACSSDESAAPSADNRPEARSEARPMQEVNGSLSYRERIALKPGTVAEIWLLDTSLADAPAEELAHQLIEDPGSPPILFVLNYEAAQIDERHSYAVRAVLRHDDRLLFTTDTHYPVLTRGAGSHVDLALIMVASRGRVVDATLVGPHWRLAGIGGRPYSHSGGDAEPHLSLVADQSRASGFAGCNSFTGTYEVKDGALSFGPMAVTARACVSGMEPEAAYLRALGKVNRFAIKGSRLVLYRDDEPLLRFEAV